MRRVLGIDLAITAESRACIADATGEVLGERGFHMRRHELEALFPCIWCHRSSQRIFVATTRST